jgi:hypothetical protein
MEDFYETRIDGVEGEIVGLFGVFDGISFSLSLTLTHTHIKVIFSSNFWHRTHKKTIVFLCVCECVHLCGMLIISVFRLNVGNFMV